MVFLFGSNDYTAWSSDLRVISKAEAVEDSVTMMMEGIATIGDPDFPQTAQSITACGWLNDGGDWSVDSKP